MENVTLKLEPRSITGKKVKQLRRAGLIPASICGKGIATEIFQLDAKTFTQVYQKAGRTTLIDLDLPSGRRSAFVRQVQIHPVTRQVIHVDFRIVDLRTEITADVPVVAVGENKLIERGDGVLQLPHPTLHVRALPADLPHAIEIDVSRITDFDTVLHVRDLNLGDKVTILTPPDEVVATITPSRTAVEAEELATEAEEASAEAAEEGGEQSERE